MSQQPSSSDNQDPLMGAMPTPPPPHTAILLCCFTLYGISPLLSQTFPNLTH